MNAKRTAREALAEFVRARRRALGDPPLRSIAAEASIPHQRWWQIEQGKGPKRPTEDLLRNLARALGVTYEQIWLAVYGAELPKGLMVVPEGADG